MHCARCATQVISGGLSVVLNHHYIFSLVCSMAQIMGLKSAIMGLKIGLVRGFVGKR